MDSAYTPKVNQHIAGAHQLRVAQADKIIVYIIIYYFDRGLPRQYNASLIVVYLQYY
jgi:hypothetical protein